MNILFSSPLYPSSRSSTCISFFFFFCMYIIINFKTTRVKTWVKISKVMPQPKSIPPGKGGKPYGKRSKSLVYNMVQLNRTYYSLFKLQAKFSKIVFPSQIPANYANSAQFAPTVHEFRKIRTFYIMFQTPAPVENPAKFQRITQIPRS